MRVAMVYLLYQIGQALMYHFDSRRFLVNGDIVRKNTLFLNDIGKARADLRYESRFHRVMVAVIMMSMQLTPVQSVAGGNLLAGQLLDLLLRVGNPFLGNERMLAC